MSDGRPRVTTSLGVLEGVGGHGARAFRGVPYARPPVGSLRFAPPESPGPWTGVRDASAPGPVAMQRADSFHGLLGYQWESMSEDCLYLDIFAPEQPAVEPRPVLAWFHGGAFMGGAGSMPIYDGTRLAADHDVVVVCVSYRVGVFGFLHGSSLYGEALPASGNQGLLDQVAALRWIRDEIAAFGGDPERVTIFGESAGGVAVSTLLGFPPAHGLFARAIVQSGNAALINTREYAQGYAERFVGELGLDHSTVSQLYELPAEALLAAQFAALEAHQRESPSALPFSPIVDGEVVGAHPLEVMPPPGTAVLAGTTRDEYRLFHLIDPAAATLTPERLERRVAKRLSPQLPPSTAGEIIATYEQARQERREPAQPGDLWAAIETDRQMFFPIQRMLGRYADAGLDCYAYRFDQPSPYENGLLGACHTLDLPFIFATYDQPPLDAYAGKGPDVSRVSAAVQGAWASFAESGAPALPGGASWPRFEVSSRTTALLRATPAVVEEPSKPEFDLWTRLAASLGDPNGLC